eukprot:TRINITY_DN467_c3_g1_i2.p1 TRINITY_DN467_c3_g1~~TRINITY_DN467_c3_g1_i2.p1  ORF type:complete len:651 (+),score=103.77 TRINITY_DN467_c3_g1_i2:84-2036(+)
MESQAEAGASEKGVFAIGYPPSKVKKKKKKKKTRQQQQQQQQQQQTIDVERGSRRRPKPKKELKEELKHLALTSATGECHFSNLPEDIFYVIVLLLPSLQIPPLFRVCVEWDRMLRSPKLWKRICLTDALYFPYEEEPLNFFEYFKFCHITWPTKKLLSVMEKLNESVWIHIPSGTRVQFVQTRLMDVPVTPHPSRLRIFHRGLEVPFESKFGKYVSQSYMRPRLAHLTLESLIGLSEIALFQSESVLLSIVRGIFEAFVAVESVQLETSCQPHTFGLDTTYITKTGSIVVAHEPKSQVRMRTLTGITAFPNRSRRRGTGLFLAHDFFSVHTSPVVTLISTFLSAAFGRQWVGAGESALGNEVEVNSLEDLSLLPSSVLQLMNGLDPFVTSDQILELLESDLFKLASQREVRELFEKLQAIGSTSFGPHQRGGTSIAGLEGLTDATFVDFSLPMVKPSLTNGLPSGFEYEPNFITIEQQRALVQSIDASPWLTDLEGKRVQVYGYNYLSPSTAAAPIPPSFANILNILRRHYGSFTELIVSEYLPGCGLDGHVDRLYWGDSIVGISLLSSCELQLSPSTTSDDSRTELPPPHSQLLPPLSLYCLKGSSRYAFLHSIDGRTVTNRRISLTFRTLSKRKVAPPSLPLQTFND